MDFSAGCSSRVWGRISNIVAGAVEMLAAVAEDAEAVAEFHFHPFVEVTDWFFMCEGKLYVFNRDIRDL